MNDDFEDEYAGVLGSDTENMREMQRKVERKLPRSISTKFMTNEEIEEIRTIYRSAYSNIKRNWTKGENTMTTPSKGDLYKVVTVDSAHPMPDQYGTYLATDAQGRYVLEMKGTNDVKAFSKKELEEVLPETIAVRFVENGSEGQIYHYLKPETELNFEVGDLLLLINAHSKSPVEVVEVGSRSKRATKTFEGWVLAKAAHRFPAK